MHEETTLSNTIPTQNTQLLSKRAPPIKEAFCGVGSLCNSQAKEVIMSDNFYSGDQEWKWMFKNGFDWKSILPLYYPNYPTEDELTNEEEVKNFLEELLEQVGTWCAGSVSDMAEDFDRLGCGEVKDGTTVPNETLSKLYREANELAIHALPLPREHGGMEVPYSVHMLNINMISRANIGASAQISFFAALGDMIHRMCPKEYHEKYIPLIAAGELSGCMCMTEPGCGSDIGAMRTTGTKQADGTYLLNGTKSFITNAGGGVAFILSRTEGAKEGLAGLSLFFADHKNEDGSLNYEVVKNEEKMGMHGSFTCELLMENTKAHLVGKEGEGFSLMLELMNEARICTGLQALGGIEACTDYANNYAKERCQFGKPIGELPLLKRLLDDLDVEKRALRALCVDTMSYYDIFQRLNSKQHHTGELNEEESKLYKEARKWTRKRTPLIKYYLTEAYTRISTKAIQVLGGYGYMQEYPVERFHRDSFGPLLYEGTSQIQSLMAMKDLLKYTMKNPQQFFSSLLTKHPTVTKVSGGSEWDSEFDQVNYSFKKKVLKLMVKTLKPENQDLLNITKWQEQESIEKLMIHAETICEGLSYLETLRVLRDHANKDQKRGELFMDYKKLVTPRLEGIYSDWLVRG
jgi:alkylation response protein AidB-like acyl-CoA dehydrogenase